MKSSVHNVVKRDGSLVDFNQSKITDAIEKAFRATGEKDGKKAKRLSDNVVKILNKQFGRKRNPTVEEIQDVVEKVLIDSDYARVAKAYILYRQKRAEIRLEKMRILEKETVDEVDKQFDVNALRVLKARYLRKDETGKLLETPKELFTRVAVHVVLPDLFYDERVFDKDGKSMHHGMEDFNIAESEGKLHIGKYKLNRYHLEALKKLYDMYDKEKKMKVGWSRFLEMMKGGEMSQYEKNIDDYFNLMVSKRFMPNTPAIANFGNPLGQGSACFVLDLEDSIESIMDTLKKAATIFKAGGGVGYNFSKLRPEGDFVKSTHGIASGPVSFMQLFDGMTEVIKQGSIRRGANMGILNINHPDIERFVTAKEGNKALRNFNISVLIFPDFWDYYNKGKPYPLLNPRNKQILKYVDPRELFNKICYQAWESAEPGVIFFDHVNDYNPFLKSMGPIVSTNPCVAADTLVAVADGRNFVTIKQLAEEGKDVPVYCYGNDSVTIRMGRCPRKTRENTEVWKVGFDDGSSIVVTPDHKFRLRNFEERECKDLKPGDRLMPFYKFQYKNTGKPSTYWGVYLNNGMSMAEHRMVSEFCNGSGVQPFPLQVVHHKNFNSLDNRIENLQVMTQSEHDRLHQKGEKNVMKGKWWDKLSEEEKDAYRKTMSKALSGSGNPMFGKKHTAETLKLISQKVGAYYSDYENRKRSSERIKNVMSDPSVRRKISEKHTKWKIVPSVCPVCKKIFDKKENDLQKCCSKSCGMSYANSIRDTSSLRHTLELRREEMRKIYYDLGLDFVMNFNRHPASYREFKKYCQSFGMTGDLRATFGGFSEFREQLQFSNHQVALVEFLGHEDVYNITVDEFHTVAYITNIEGKTKRTGMPLLSGIITSQCGEVLLYPNESCNLGSINVWSFMKQKSSGKKVFDWDGLKDTILLATRFLDNVIDVNKYPLPEIEDVTHNTRKVGLGVMGVADLLFELNLAYNSDEGRAFMEKLMEFVNYYSKVESVCLAKERGVLPYFDKSFFTEGKLPAAGFYDKKGWHFDWGKVSQDIKEFGIRNGFTTVLAPTGSISMIAGCSSGIEPLFALVFEKNVKVGSFYYIDPVFEDAMKDEGLYDEELIKHISDNRGSIRTIRYVPEKLKKVFVTSMDVKPDDHIKALAAFQKWVDSSVSKTNNLPAEATIEDVKKSYMLSYELGCKDVTVYRDTSLKQQVLTVRKKEDGKETAEEVKSIVKRETNSNNVKKCPNDNRDLVFKEGCWSCPECGYGYCAVA